MDYSGISYRRARKTVAVCLAFVFVAAAFVTFAADLVKAVDTDPNLNLEITINIWGINQIDTSIDWYVINFNPADFYNQITIAGTTYDSRDYVSNGVYEDSDQDGRILATWYPLWTLTVDVDDSTPTHDIRIELMDDDDWPNPDERCDISGYDTSDATITYDLRTATWSGSGDTVENSGDSNGLGHVSGAEDGETDQCDCELWFSITQNDVDEDGLTYWQETNGFVVDGVTRYTNPTVANDEDFDHDGVTACTEYQENTAPLRKDTDEDGLWDGFEHNHPLVYGKNSADGDYFIKSMLASLTDYETSIPVGLMKISDWFDDSAFYAFYQEYLLSIAYEWADVDPEIKFVRDSSLEILYGLGTDINTKYGVGLGLLYESQFVVLAAYMAVLKYYQAVEIFKDSITMAWMHLQYPNAQTYGYLEQARIGTKNTPFDLSGRLAAPSWNSGTKSLEYGGLTSSDPPGLCYYYVQEIKILRHLLHDENYYTDWDGDGRVTFQDILYIERCFIAPMIDADGAPNSEWAGVVNNFRIFNRETGQFEIKDFTDTGYDLEHYLLEFCRQINSAFSSNWQYVGAELSPLPHSDMTVAEVCADLTGSIGCFGATLVQTMRDRNTRLLSIAPDLTAPSVSSISVNGGAKYTHSQTVDIRLTASEEYLGSGLNAMLLSNDGSSWVWNSYYSQIYWQLWSGDGLKTIYVKVLDVAGNTAGPFTLQITLDMTPPVTSTSIVGQVVTLSASDALSGVDYSMYKIDYGGTWNRYYGPFGIGVGTHTLYYYSVDKAGATEAEKSKVFVVDNAPPCTTVTLTGLAGTNGWFTNSVQVTVDATDGSGSGIDYVYLKIDDYEYPQMQPEWLPYSTYVYYDGTHTVLSYAVDNAGNVEATKTTTVKIDFMWPTNPGQYSASRPTGVWYNSAAGSVTISWSGASDATSGIAGYSWAVNGDAGYVPDATIETTTTSVTVGMYELGPNYLHVRAVDNAGNGGHGTNGLPSALHIGPFLIDNNWPDSEVSSIVGTQGYDGWYRSDVIVTLSASDGAGSGISAIYYTLDADWASGGERVYTGPLTFGSAAYDATTYIWVRAVDNVGRSAWGHGGGFGIDVKLPFNPTSCESTQPVGSWSDSSQIGVEWSGAVDPYGAWTRSGIKGYSIEWSQSATTVPDDLLDTTDHYAVSAPLTEGSYYLHVRSIDRAGNAAVGAYHIGPFHIDFTAPSTTSELSDVNGNAGYWYAGPEVTVSFSAVDPVGEGVVVTEYRTSLMSDDFTGGDSAGWRLLGGGGFAGIDTGVGCPTAPCLKLTKDNVYQASYAWQYFPLVSEGRVWAEAKMQVNDASQDKWSNLELYGNNFLEVAVRFMDGEIKYLTTPDGWIGTGVPYSAGVWYEIGLDVDLANGVYDIYVDGELKTPGVPLWQSPGTHCVDRIAFAAGYDDQTGVILWADDVKVFPVQFTAYAGPFAVPGEGHHSMDYRSIDSSGNAEEVRSVSFGIDATPPTNPTSNSSNIAPDVWQKTSDVSVQVSGATDALTGVAGYSYCWDSLSSTVPDAILDTSDSSFNAQLTDGVWYLHVRAIDGVGNPAVDAYTVGPFKVDTTAPTSSASHWGEHGLNGWHIETVTVFLSSSDQGVGGTTIYYLFNPTSGQLLNPDYWYTYTAPINIGGGTCVIYYRSVDALGNWEWWKTAAIKVDQNLPTNPNQFTSDHVVGEWSSVSTVRVDWSGAFDANSGVWGYSVVWNQNSGTLPDSVKDTSDTWSVSPALSDGTWYLHIRTEDYAGHWTTGAYHVGPFKIDVSAPTNPTTFTSSHTVGVWSTDSTIDVTWYGASDGSGSGVYGYSYVWDHYSGTLPDEVVDTTETSLTNYQLSEGGVWYLHVRACDVSGKWALDAYHIGWFILDLAPPTTQWRIDAVGSGGSGWYSPPGWDPPTVTMWAVDDGSGVFPGDIHYRVDGGTWITYTAPYDVSGDGAHLVECYSVDQAGRTESVKSFSVNIDTGGPTTSYSLSGTAGSNGWYNSDVTVALDAADPLSGVDYIYYKIDGALGQYYSGPFTIGSGTHEVFFWARDRATNPGGWQTIHIDVDYEDPVTVESHTGTLGSNGWYTSFVTVTLTASDSLSGPWYTDYRWNGPAVQYTGPFVVNEQGTHTVMFYSYDLAGNLESTKSVTVKIDTVSPTTTAGAVGSEVTLTATDATSLVAATYYRIDSGNWLVYAGKFSVGSGTHTVEYYSVDNAGNVEQSHSIEVKETTVMLTVYAGYYTNAVWTPLTSTVVVDGLSGTTGQAFPVAAGASHTVKVQDKITVSKKNYYFQQWEGYPASTNPDTFVPSGNMQLRAVFTKTVMYTLDIQVNNPSLGYTSPAGVQPPSLAGATITVTAYPNSGYQLSYWLLDGATVRDNPYTVTMNSGHVLKAVFEPLGTPQKYSVTVQSVYFSTTWKPINTGTVTIGTQTVAMNQALSLNGGSYNVTYPATYKAAGKTYTFSYFEIIRGGVASGHYTNGATITIDADITIKAYYVK